MPPQKEPLTLPNVIIFIVNFCHYTITHLFSVFILLQKIWGKWLREVQTIDKKSSVFKCALVLLCRYFSNRSRLASFLWSFILCDLWLFLCNQNEFNTSKEQSADLNEEQKWGEHPKGIDTFFNSHIISRFLKEISKKDHSKEEHHPCHYSEYESKT